MSDIAKKTCVLIPAFREEKRIAAVVAGALKHCPSVAVIDDGSDDCTACEAQKAGATVIRHARNMGKGMALHTGAQYARQNGYQWIITMDADGQHDPDDIPRFLTKAEETGCPAIIGNRMGAAGNMPLVRRLTNRFMSWLLSREMGIHVPDTQVGFRMYRTDLIPEEPPISPRFAAESEILLRLSEKITHIESVPIKVIYRDEKSKIRPLRDTVRFFSMLMRYRRERQVA